MSDIAQLRAFPFQSFITESDCKVESMVISSQKTWIEYKCQSECRDKMSLVHLIPTLNIQQTGFQC